MKTWVVIAGLFLLAFFLFSRSWVRPDAKNPARDSLQVRIVKDGLTMPWEILWGPDDRIWMTERSGKVSRLNPETGELIPVYQVPDVAVTDFGGLLGMALHPQFSVQPHVFLVYNYVDKTRGHAQKVVRYEYRNQTLENPEVLLTGITGTQDHNGSRLLITTDQKLFITTGDGSKQNVAQQLDSLNGKLLRVNLDGSIPADNPFPKSPVWSLGHRNQQGMAQVGDRLYATEHGPDTDDEINLIRKGGNYGWPVVAGYCDDNQKGEKAFCAAHKVVEPMHVWTPTVGLCTLDYYDKALLPQWKNSLLATSLKGSSILQIQLDRTGDKVTKVNEFLTNRYGRLRDLCIAPNGKVYVATNNIQQDKILEISVAQAPN